MTMMQPDNIILGYYEIPNYKTALQYNPEKIVEDILKMKKCLEAVDENYHMLMYENTLLRSRIQNLETSLTDMKIISNLLKTVNENEMLKTEWERFMMFVKLAATPDKGKEGEMETLGG